MSASSSHHYDAVVIGAGLNGLTAATVLAKSGRRVLVLEQADRVGGLAVGREIHPGFQSHGLLHDTTGLLPEVVDGLALAQHGLRRTEVPPPVLSASRDGQGLLLHHEAGEADQELAALGSGEHDSYARYRAFLSLIRPLTRRLFSELPPDVLSGAPLEWKTLLSHGMAFRRLGKAQMMELLRVGPMCVADFLGEFFPSNALKAALAVPALRGYWGGPHSPGTNGTLLRYETMASGEVVGGPGALVDALSKAASSAGVEVKTSAAVQEIRVSGGTVTGVVTTAGHTYDAPWVLSSCEPKSTFFKLVNARHIEPSFEHSIRAFRMRGTVAAVHLALDRRLRFVCRPDAQVTHARTAQDLIELEKAFDAVKYGTFADTLPLEVFAPDEKAPAGKASVTLIAHGVPFDLRAGWNDENRERLGDVMVASLAPYVDDLPIVAREVLSPADIESRYGVTNGHVYHGEQGLDQLIARPEQRCSRYATPINGLYLCGSGTHPGGGITCGPGWLAARTVLALG